MAQQPGAYPRFDRDFFAADQDFTVIGGGELGGKALGLASAKRILTDAGLGSALPDVQLGIPRLTVIGSEVFERFLADNDLWDTALADLPDDRIAHAFVRAELPALMVGDLRALIGQIRVPLAVRSSSTLEDALEHPFAGVYATKMVPNNESSVDERFRRLAGAMKLVWASTFFRDAKQYMRSIDRPIEDERMAVIVQEVIGERFGDRFYPIVSGVIRTHNYYPSPPAKAEDGLVHLALGLGKSIVDGGLSWSYSPRYPRHRPPFGSVRELMSNTQTRFWAVNMAPVPYDPVNEAECLVEVGLDEAEWDDVLRFIASTYDAASDRLTIGTGIEGPRALTFARILELNDVPLNEVVRRVSRACQEALDAEVEIEFALTLDRRRGLPARFGFLQVRPMMVTRDPVDVADDELASEHALVASERVLGNGRDQSLRDVLYVKPDAFEATHTRAIAAELEKLNRELVGRGDHYLLIGFGRWGSADPWLGIPATWPQVSGARAIVEATLPAMNVDASQGSHFFHNLISFRVLYFMVRHEGPHAISWDWLDRQPAASETRFLRHVRLAVPLQVRVDGRSGRGVILHD
jgi:hypothetical protein